MNPEAKVMIDYCASIGIKTGQMLDLGAGDDAVGDSSIAKPFINAGWDVTLVDASPSCVAIQARAYGTHPNVQVVSALVTAATDAMLKFYEIPGDLALSTASDALMARGVGRQQFNTVHMQSLPVADLWDEMGPFDAVSVDLEGVSVAVAERLMSLDDGPRVLCVEAFPVEVLGVDEAAKLEGVAKDCGYKVHARLKENIILVRA